MVELSFSVRVSAKYDISQIYVARPEHDVKLFTVALVKSKAI